MTTTTNPLVRERAAGTARGRWLALIVLLAGHRPAGAFVSEVPYVARRGFGGRGRLG
jgi:hypothetical protein